MLQRKSFVSCGTTLSIGALAALAFLVGCSSSSGPAMTTAAAVSGPADMHCTMNGMDIKQSIGMCVTTAAAKSALSADGGDDGTDDGTDDASVDAAADAGASDDTAVTTDADASDDAGAGDDGAGADAGSGDDAGDNGGGDYGPTLYNFEGDDDDCKYHVKWTSTAVKENVGVTFQVNVIRKIDDKPATGADIVIEAFSNPMHPTPTVDIPSVESAGGNYKVGPFVFDQSGMWTVRFHFYETCSDEPEDSPHGHAAFFIKVP